MSVRPDGATRGDLAEATALVVAGVALTTLPIWTFFDRLAVGWMWLSAAVAAVGLASAALGLRWFLVEGPPLVAAALDTVPALGGGADPPLPATVKVVDARDRLVAHSLRFAAIGSGAVLMLVSLGPLKWAVLALFGASFVADQVLLRPHRYVLDRDGLRRRGLFGERGLRWAEVSAVYWRHYPDDVRPPFPSGERVIIERTEGKDLELVFHRRYGGSPAELVVRSLRPLVGDRLRVLTTRSKGQAVALADAPTVDRFLAEADLQRDREESEAPSPEGAAGAGEP